MKKITIVILILVAFAGISGYSLNAPISTIGTVTTTGISATVPITAINFTNVASGELTINYDQTITTVTSVTQVAEGPLLGGLWNVNLNTPGLIIIEWSTYPGLTLPGTVTVANITFTKIMDGTSALTFNDSGSNCDWWDGDFLEMDHSPFSSYFINGSLTFNSLPAPVTTAPVLSACSGTSIQVPITVTGFTNIGAVSLTLHYNPAILTYNSATNNSGFPGLMFGGSTPGTVVIAGFANSGINLPDNSTLFTLNFTGSGVGGSTVLTWDSTNATACQYNDYPGYDNLSQSPFINFYHNGNVTVYASLTASISGGSTPICYNTSPGTFTATGGGGTGSYTYQWYNTNTGLIGGATNSTYSPGNLIITTGFYCAITSGICGTVNTPTTTITVSPNNTITLSSAAGTNSQTVCINTPITDITYSTTGATNATFSGLPTGVTGGWLANVVTITGTPSVSGTFNYTVTLTGGCGTITASGTITVTPSNTITLSSGTGTDNQTVCINNPIMSITYSTTGATGATFSGLPTGVTGNWSSNVVTISGSPSTTTGSPFNYTVTLTGGCGPVTVSGTITVITINAITLTSASGTDEQTVCLNTPITTITYSTTGATGATFSGLPTGVTGGWLANVVTITGTPSVLGTFNFTVTLTGGCGTIIANGSITVTPNNTITLTSGAGTIAQTVCISTPITNITYSTTGATNATFSGLPTGVTGLWAANVVTISGTPSLSGTFNYTVTLTGGCGIITTSGTITVTPNNTITLTSATGTNAQTVCINNPITNITYSTNGATGATFSGLPTGVTGLWAANVVTISGTPSVSGTSNYTVTLTGGCGIITASGTITVTPNNTITLTSVAGTIAQTVCINTPITNITYSTTGATGATFSGLPTGVTGLWAANVVTISGTPSVSGTSNYTVTLTGGCGIITASGTITVTPNNTIALTSATGTNAQTVCINNPITNITYSTTGATNATFSSLPTGVTGLWAANVVTISGTPSVSGTYNYTVTLTGGCGTITASGTITVTSSNTITLSSGTGTNNQTVCINTPITNITYSTNGATGATFSGLPTGVTGLWAANVVTISGTPSVTGTFNYTVTLTGGCGTITANGSITVNARPTPTISGSGPVCVGTTGVLYTTQPGMSNYSWGISSGGTITAGGSATDNTATVTWNTVGTQTISVNYTDPATGCTALLPFVYTVPVNPRPSPSLTGNTTTCTGVNNVYTTDAGYSNYIWYPAGGTIISGGGPGDNTATISWSTPGTKPVGVNYQNSFGCYALTATDLTVTVGLDNTIALTSATGTNAQTVCINTPITNITYTTTEATGATFSGLPTGVTGSWLANVVTITGTPSVSGTYNYTVTLTGGCGTITASGTITVNPLPTPTITGNTPVCLNSTGNVYTTQSGSGIHNYIWNVTGGSITAGGTATDYTVTVTWTTIGTESVSVNYTNINGCAAASPTVYHVTVNDLPIVSAATLQNSLNPTGPWSAMNGTLAGGYSMCINPAVPFYYLDINTMTVSQSLMANTLNPFTLSQTSLPGGWLAYWAAKGVVSGATGWQGVMWQIINGNAPIFYIYYTGSDYQLIDGLTYQTGGGITPLRVSGDYPQGTYTYNGTVTDVTGCVSLPFNVMTTFNTIPVVTAATLQNSLNPTGPWSAMNGTLAGGYSMCINPAVPFYYLDINTMTVSQSLMANTLNPFTLSQTGLPGGWLAYWAAKGVVSGATGWQGVMWQIINGNAPIFYIYYTGGDYQLIDGLTYQTGGGITPLRISGDYPQGTYTYNGTVTDVNGCVSLPFNVMTTFNTTPVVTAATLQNSLNPTGPWSAMNGTLAGGYSMCINPAVPFYYLDINTMTVSQSLMANTLNPFTLSQTGLPGGWLAYWAAKGVVSGATGWQGVMWQIINGNAPIFYIYYTGGDYQIIDGLTYQTGGGITPLRVSGDYPQGTYTYNGTVTDVNGCVSLPFNVMTTFNTIPVPILSGPTPVCLNSTGNVYTTETGMTGYIWAVTGGSITAGGTATDNTVTVTWTTVGTESVSVNYTDINGCTAASPTVYDVVVNPLPTPTITGNTPVCFNSTGNVYTTQSGSGIHNYIWAVTGGSITAGGTATDNTVTVTWTTIGTESVSVNYTDINGCTAASPTVYHVMVYGALTASISGGTSPICYNTDPGLFTATGAGGTGSYTYLWYKNGVSTGITTQTYDPGLLTATSTFYCEVTSGSCGTVTTNTITIIVSPNNTITLTSATGTNAQTVCINTPITNITYTTTGATGATFSGLPTGVTGSWLANVVTISGTPSVSGTFNYTVTLTGGCGTITANGSITVTPNNTITLTSVAGTIAQTVCINTPITNITYSTTGATNATFSGLPTGVTGGWLANVVTITGTPSVSGTFNYTVTLTGGCGIITASGTITVTPNNTIALTSATGTNAQTVCINTPITNITYSTTGATNATFSGLPTGVTGSWLANVVTITGTPSVSGTFNYMVTLTGGCGIITASGTITVTPNNTITLSSGAGTNSQTVCINTPITNITYSTTGATGATFSGLPTGVTGGWLANVVTISGTPSVSGTFNYTVTLTGGCGLITASGTITVTPNNTITLSSGAGTNSQTVCINTPITNITYTTTGATGATFSGLPTGVTGGWLANVVTISGIPSVSGTFNYTVTLTGGCGSTTANGSITIILNNTITLTSALGTDAQTLCINTPITNITYSTAGATGATFSGLPSGVTGSWLANVVTISGTPSVSGTFNYTVSLTGGCGTITANGSITVTPNNTITLSSGTGTNNQTVCINTPITNITYSTTGATNATFSGLPTGVTGSWLANVVTISGTPSLSGTFNYTVTLTGGCGTITANGTITVNPNNTIIFTSGAGTNAQTVCINIPIANITYTTTGATGATFSGLPTGVTGSWLANVVTISGTPSVSGTFNYTVTLTGGCSLVTASGTITVTPNNTITLSSGTGTDNQTVCINTPIVNITYSTTGATNATFSGLPTGVTGSWLANVVTISGTPSVSGTFNYTVTLTGGCGSITANGTITVSPNNTITLTSGAGTNVQTVCINTPITNITYSTTGATGVGFTGFPAGITGTWIANVVTISGSPTVTGTFNYTVTLTGGCGNITANGTITVNPNNTSITLTSGAGTNNQTLCIFTPITNITYSTLGGTGASFSGLPAGVTGSWAANVATISGSPTVSGTFNYTVTITGGCGNASANGTITVTPNNTIILISASGTDAQTVCINTPITNITYGATGATGATITGLPAGVTGVWLSLFNVVNISGIPTVSGTFNYMVTLSGGCGIITANGTITVDPNNTIILTSGAGTDAQTVCINTPITNITYTTTGATGATFSGLPTGVTGGWLANVVTITGTPSVSGTFNYTVTLTGGCGIITASGTITVTPNNTIALTSGAGTDNQTLCINTPITNITYATTGVTGATFTGLPAGVTGSWAANVVTISGTPSVSGTFNYLVTLTGGCGNVTANGTITVTPNNIITLVSPAGTNAQTVCINTAIASIIYATTGATGATFTGLPAGVTGVWAANIVTISGTPSVSGTFNYTVTLSGGCGTITANGTITVNPVSTIILTSVPGTNSQTVCINTPITNITYATTGATGATFNGLPAGVTGIWAANVVIINGIPTVSGTFIYTVTLTGGCGNITANGSITVTPNNTITLTSASGTDAQTVCINTPITNITYSTTGATVATFSGLPTGVTGGWLANVVTISGTPTLSGTFNYTVTLTGGCGNITANGSITVNPTSTINLTSAAGTNAQTVCISTPIVNITYSTTGATGATFSGLPTGVTGGWLANVVTITGTPSVSGTFNYTVTLTGGCGIITASGTITVTPNNTIALTSATGTNAQTVCINTPITNITYSTTGATGATFSGLPTGVTGVWAANVVTISGTPSVSGTSNYTVTLTGGCGIITASGTITVTPNNTITLTSAAGTNAQTVCINTPITNITYSTTGATNATFSGLPTGVTGGWLANVVTISGTPSVSGTFNYTVTLTGGCGIITASGTITVTPNNTISLTSATGTDAQTVCISTPIVNITYSTTGATGATFSGLPTGVTGGWLANVVTISGTPSVSGTFNYTVTLTGGCGIITASGTITVTPNNTITLSSGAGTNSQTVCINTPITNITYSTTGATNATFSGLPAGVTGGWLANVVTITGTPSVSGTFNYTVTLTGGCGIITASGTITVTPNNTITLSSGAGTNSQTVCINTPITNITYTTTGATGATFSGLPTGVTGGWLANVVTITGTPSVSGTFNYTVTLTGGCGIITASGTITVTPNNTITLSSGAGTNSQTVCINTPITNITYSTTGATGATFSGLPTGVTGLWAANVVTISGTPSVSGTSNYTVTLTGGCGIITASGTITVTPNNTITLTSATGTNSQTVCSNTPIVNITYSTTGATGATISGLPTGVAGSWLANVVTISGLPTVSGTFNYTVTLTGGCGIITASGTITVTPNNTITLTSGVGTNNQNVCINFPITNITYSTTGATGATFSGLPAGVTGVWAANVVTISGTPTGIGVFNYTVTLTGGCGNIIANGTITVSSPPTPTITGPASVCVNSTGNVYTTQAGNTNYVWTVSPGGSVMGGGSSTSNTVTVTWNTVGAQFVGVNYTIPGGCTAPVATTFNVTVNPRPVPTITGPNPVCVGSTGNVYTTQAGMSGYTWVISAGGTIMGGIGTNALTVTWTTVGAQTVSVNYNNVSGCPALAPTVYNVTVIALPVPTITGPTPICVGATGNVYTTQAGMTNYIWSVSGGGAITGGGGSTNNTVTVTWNLAGAQTVSVTYTNSTGCTAAAPAVYNVTVSAIPVPTITGQTSMCVNSGYYNYTTEAGMQNYVWNVSSGGIINYGSGTNQIQVSWIVAGTQTVSVIYTNAAGCNPVAPAVLNVTVNPAPDPAGNITGTATVCAGTNGVAYSVAPIPNATTYVWALPPNATIASGAGTNSITVNFGTNATSGVIIVYGNNICGDGPNSPPFAVTVNPLPDPAGTISGPADVCSGATGVVYSVPAIANATGYTWTVPAGVTITSGNNTNSITVTFTPSAVSGNMTVKGTNSCGSGTVSPNFAVTVNPIPPTPVVTNHGDTLFSSAPTGNQWYDLFGMIAGATGQTYVATVESYYWVVVTLNGCSSAESNHLQIKITGIESHPASVINLYPVPNDGLFNIAITTASEESFTIGVYNNLGVKIYETHKVVVSGSLIREIDLRPAPNGMYTVIITGDRETAIKKIIVNH